MEINEALKQIKAVAEQQEKYKNVISNYQKYAEELRNMGERLIMIAKEIDPYMQKSSKANKIDYKTVAQDIYNKMLQGQEVTPEWIRNVYNFQDNEILHLYHNTLKKLPKVQIRKQGRQSTLYI